MVSANDRRHTPTRLAPAWIYLAPDVLRDWRVAACGVRVMTESHGRYLRKEPRPRVELCGMRGGIERPDGVAGGVVREATEPTPPTPSLRIEYVEWKGEDPDQWWAYDDETPELTGLGNTLEPAAEDLKNQQRTKPDPRDPDHSRLGIFVHHNCWKCGSGEKPCVEGNPSRCSFPVARND